MKRNGPFLLVVFFVLLCPRPAPASGCLSQPTVAQALKDSKMVFAGKVVARLKYGVRFKVERSWKGISSWYIYVYTGNIRNDADPWFQKDQRWLVYASDVRLYENGNLTGPYVTKLMARACNRTVLLSNAAEDLRQLGKGSRPLTRAVIKQNRFR